MRVLHVVLSLDVGGLERVVLDLLRHGRDLGQEPAVLCVQRPGALASAARDLGAGVYCVNKPAGLRPGVVGRIRALLAEVRPDVVHTHQVAALLYAGPAARLAGVRAVVHTEHGKNYAHRRQSRWLGRLAACTAGRFVCVSRDIMSEVLTHRIVPRRKLFVTPNGIDPAPFGPSAFVGASQTRSSVRRELGISPDAPVVGTIGRLSEIKRQGLLIAAAAEVRKRRPDLRLLLVGDGPARDELRDQARRLGLEGVVHFVGYQSAPQRFLRSMDVFALTSRSEGMPLGVLEAFAAGVPVIASRVGGVPELIEHETCGLLFESGDVNGLAAGLERLLADRDLRAGLADAARERVESRFHVNQMAAGYHRHYSELLGSELLGCADRRTTGRNMGHAPAVHR